MKLLFLHAAAAKITMILARNDGEWTRGTASLQICSLDAHICNPEGGIIFRFSLSVQECQCGCAAFAVLCRLGALFYCHREIDIPLYGYGCVKSRSLRDLLNLKQKISRYSKSNFVQINKRSSGHAKRRQKWPPAAGDGRYATFLASFCLRSKSLEWIQISFLHARALASFSSPEHVVQTQWVHSIGVSQNI